MRGSSRNGFESHDARTAEKVEREVVFERTTQKVHHRFTSSVFHWTSSRVAFELKASGAEGAGDDSKRDDFAWSFFHG